MQVPAGDPGSRTPIKAVAALYDQFARSLFQTALTILGRTDRAEDAVQETFVGLVRARVVVTDLDNARAYLFAALRNASARIGARAMRERPVPPETLTEVASPEPRATDIDRSDQLDRALRSLPAEQREVIGLKIDGGLTFGEIAACLGVSPNTVASRYRYALEKLRTALEEADRDT